MKHTRLLNWLLVPGVMFGLGLAGVGSALPQSDFDRTGQTKLAKSEPDAMKSGRITAKSDDSVTIDGRVYPLHPNVDLSDSVGGKMRWKDFTVNVAVKFHLTKDGKVDQLVALDSPG
jgi:hypothetical protein